MFIALPYFRYTKSDSKDFGNRDLMASLTRKSLEAGQSVLARRSSRSRKAHGQFLTPESLAKFMAEQLGTIADGDCVLDPAVGSGTLLCTIIDRLIAEGDPSPSEASRFCMHIANTARR